MEAYIIRMSQVDSHLFKGNFKILVCCTFGVGTVEMKPQLNFFNRHPTPVVFVVFRVILLMYTCTSLSLMICLLLHNVCDTLPFCGDRK